MKQKRILHCIASMGGGGAERQLSYLSRGLVSRGWDVHVALTTGGPNLKALEASGASIHRIPGRVGFLLPKLTALACTLKPDIVQTWLPKMDIVGGLVARAARVPFVLSERSTGSAYVSKTRDRIRAFLGTGANAIIANSERGLEYWQGRVRKGCCLQVIPNAVPTDRIGDVDKADLSEFGISPNQSVVLYAGRLEEQKNIMRLAQALEMVVATNPSVYAAICGEGPLRHWAESFVANSKHSNRMFVRGYVDPLWSWMKVANVFVSVSLYEGRPNTVLEAMACGCPLVISDIPEHREILTDRMASFVPVESPDGIAQSILSVLAGRDSAAERALSAQKAVQQWHVDEIARRYELAYLDVLANSHRHAKESV